MTGNEDGPSVRGRSLNLRVVVRNGRLVLDVPAILPEGTVLDLVVDDERDDLDDAERPALDETLAASEEDVRAGRVRPAAELIDELRRR